MRSVAERTDSIKEYYGRTIRSTGDLKTGACCSTESLPGRVRQVLKNVDAEILGKSYGCGSPIPPALDGCVVLDLGCGAGRDVYVLSKLVGEAGKAIGVDMTPEQLEVARRHIVPQMRRFGFAEPNVEFKDGYIDDLKGIGIADNSVDVVISNCVINLANDKCTVFSEIFRVLRPGGELYFSDVFAGRRVPAHLQSDTVLLGECLAGALYIEDFRRLLRDVGCPDYRVLSQRRFPINSPEIEAKVGMIDFHSVTVRAFKLDGLEDICEDYGQVGTYRGTIPESPHRFLLDDHHVFETGRPKLVCGNTASMIGETRYARHFDVTGDRSTHYGKFGCGPGGANKEEGQGSASGGACC